MDAKSSVEPIMSGRTNFYSHEHNANGDGKTFQKTVILAVDGSDQAEKSVDWYFKMIHKPENRIVMVHVPEARDLELARDVRLTIEDVKDIAEHCNKSIIDLMLKFRAKLDGIDQASCIFRTIHGKPGEVLVDAANTEDATLIVMGTRGLGKVRRTILGSVSDYVVQHASTPVIVYRQN
jgi:nucleotide-binding universal stress UspA family protein